MRRLAILGAGGHGRVVADCAEEAGWADIVFFDDSPREGDGPGVWPLHGDSATLFASLDDYDGVVVAIGDNRRRLELLDDLEGRGAPLPTIVHPGAIVSRHATLGPGTVVIAGGIVNAFARLGRGCIVNTGATVGHDCVLEEGVHVAPGASLGGGVRVGRLAWIGIGSSVRQEIRIGAGAVIGAGAAVVRDVGDEKGVTGVPARPRD